jgi:hypothetical protein
LNATASGLTAATSNAFNVTAGAATTLVFTTGPTSRSAGTAFSPSLQVEARDGQGNIVPAFTGTVTLAIAAGTGTPGAGLLGTVSQAAVSGVATFAGVSVNLVGTGYQLNATSAGLTTATSGVFNITPGNATQLAFTTQPVNTNAGSPITPAVVVTARDQFGNTATGFNGAVSVNIAPGTGTGGAVLSGSTTVGASSGVATFSNLSINLVGTGYQLQSTSAGLTTATSAAFNITSSTATQLAFTAQPSTATSGVAIAPAVQVTARDASGNPATGFTGPITVAITNGTGTGGAVLSGTLTVSAVAGVATFSNLSINLAGTGYTLTATSAGLTSATSSAFNINPAAATQLAFTVQPTSRNAGVAFSPSVQVTARDAAGNTATSFAGGVTIAITGGTGTTGANLLGTLTQTASAGVATFAGVSVDSAGAGYTLRATSGALTAGTSAAFNIDPTAASQLVFTRQPVNTGAGAEMTPGPQVTAKDSFGNTVTTYTGAVSIGITSGTGTGGAVLSGQTVVGAVAGVATFSGLSINLVGTGYTFTATAAGLSNAVSTAFSIGAGSATQLDFTTQPTATTAGSSISPAIQVAARDGQGNIVGSFTGNVTLAITGGTGTSGANLGGTLTQAAVNGVATFANITIDSAGTGYTLTATSAGLSNDISSAFNINAGTATHLVFTTQPSTTTSQSSISPAVQVTARDALGNRATSFSGMVGVALGGGTGGAVLSGTTSVAASSGIATFSNLSVDLVGTGYTLTATSGALTQAVSTGFNITPGTATQLVFTQQPSNGTAGTPIAPAVTVTARDAAGNVATGFVAAVTLTITPGTGTGGAVASSNVVGAVSGVATFSNLSINLAGTAYTLDATTGQGGVTGSTSTAFDIVAGAAASLQFSAEPSGSQTAGISLAPEIEITARDNQGNVATGFAGTVTLTITDGTGTGGAMIQGGTSVAATTGVSRFPGLVIDSAGTDYTITASTSGIPSASSSAFDVAPGSAAVLVFTTQPTTTGAGATIPNVVVTARDDQGNTATGFNSSVTMAITNGTGMGGAALGGTTVRTAASGVATFNDLDIDLAGTAYTLTASATGPSSGVSAAFNITAGTAATLEFSIQPASPQTAGDPFAPAVEVTARDNQGNVATSFAGQVTVAITGGTGTDNASLTGTTVVSASSGVATFSNLLIDLAGTGYTLTASATGPTSAISDAFTVSPGAAAVLVFTTQPSNATAGDFISPAVTVTARDDQGNTATGFAGLVTMSLAGGTAGADFTGASTTQVSASSGIATFSSLAVDSAGTGYTLSASGVGTPPTSSSFDVIAGAAASLDFTTEPTTVTAGLAMAIVEVTARDDQGNVATGFTGGVSLSLNGGPANAGFTASATVLESASDGIAQFASIRIDSAGAGYTLTASATGPSAGASAAFSVNPGSATTLLFTTQPVNTVQNAAIPTVAVTARDSLGNRDTGFTDPVGIVITPGSGTLNAVLSGTTPQNAVAGVASFPDLSIDLVGTAYTLTASSGALTDDISDTFEITMADLDAFLMPSDSGPRAIFGALGRELAYTRREEILPGDRASGQHERTHGETKVRTFDAA